MLRIATLSFTLLIACGGSPPPPAETPPAPPPAPAEVVQPSDAGPNPDQWYQEALLCMQDCEETEEGDMDTLDAMCRERCGLPPREQ